MRGGNRQKPQGGKRHPIPGPPKGSSAGFRRAWRLVQPALEQAGTYGGPSDFPRRCLLVQALVIVDSLASDPTAPATARVRAIQAAGSALDAFGLSPLARERVQVPDDERSIGQRILDGEAP